jgi:hypothetical protein
VTPLEIETMARQRYNAVGDSFWASTEMMGLIWQACGELAREAKCIRRVFTTTTVASTREYAFPTNVTAIKRVTYNGQRLDEVQMQVDDDLTSFSEATISMGMFQAFTQWDETLYLRPIPDAAYTLKIYGICEPQEVTSTSTLEVPTEYHQGLCDFLNMMMAAKDKNLQAAQWFEKRWDMTKAKAIRQEKAKQRGGNLLSVYDAEGWFAR